jgi:4-alpha-glucanotransferase
MSADLDRLAGMVGIERDYVALSGETVRVSDKACRATLKAMGLSPRRRDAGQTSIPKVALDPMVPPPGVFCFLPEWLREGRCWGIGCQLYGLRSARNWGIGDFEDLARLAEIAAAAGADFMGVNPLHALFLAEPGRCSPFSPSSRQFLNPLYIAIDGVPGFAQLEEALAPPTDLRESELVDYGRVGPLKRRALQFLFRIFEANGSNGDREAFESFVAAGGQALYLHALFEALSEAMTEQGHGAGWHGWPEEYRHPATASVHAFAEERRERITFHSWLQFLADRQLAEAQARARRVGMRIGLYLDLAVGVASDGSATWADRDLVVPAARIGAPPDYFNAAGQDWGIAPLSPAELVERRFEPYRESLDSVVRHAGALRIDHAMSLYRLFWIAEGFTAADGVYVRYPFHAMLGTLAEVSQARRAIVIGEDLGVVPPGFRDVMRALEIQSYRVFFFEKEKDGFFIAPEKYPRQALACLTTHDLHTLAGWWSGHDIERRRDIGMIEESGLDHAVEERAHERRRLLGLLVDHGLLPEELAPIMRGEAEPPPAMPAALAVALHQLVARTPSRLLVLQLDDLTGAVEQVNIPGTNQEHPNWRRRLPVDLESLPEAPLFKAITATVRQERPKSR